MDINFELVPKNRHYKNPIESKHGIIRSIFNRLKHDGEEQNMFDKVQAALKSVSISNDLYGNNLMSSFELAKGYTRPLVGIANAVPPEILEAQQKLNAKRKLCLILKSKSVSEMPLSVGDMVQTYNITKSEKRGKWSAPKNILSIDKSSRTVTVSGKAGHKMTFAIEDVLPSLKEDELSELVQHSIDELEQDVQTLTDDHLIQRSDHQNSQKYDLGKCGHRSKHSSQPSDESSQYTDDDPLTYPDIGDSISVLWPLDDQFYDGIVHSQDPDGNVKIHYQDGDVENLDLTNETWKYTETSTANSAQPTVMSVETQEPEVLNDMLQHFGNKQFMLHQAQGFPQFPLVNAFNMEEDIFLKTVQIVPLNTVP